MHMTKAISCYTAALIFFFSSTYSQHLSESTIRKIDHIFQKWDNPHTPGAVIGIVQNDSLIYSKGYGQADLEHSTPNTPGTIYYMASVSKQSTAYAVVLLARQGRLKLDDDIRQYLPWMADFGQRITIRNMLNHTSGIRDDIDLAEKSGLLTRQVLTQQLALEILKKEHSLIFSPGNKFSYSNSNFVLLAEIVRVVSGQSLQSFISETIFKPLGMSHSRFIGDDHEVIGNRALSYVEDKRNFVYDPQTVYTLGDGGLFTNIIDMAHWVSNFYNPKSGDARDIEQLTERGRLNNGREIDYALGIYCDYSRGYRRFMHNGGLAGYRTALAIYPDLKMGFIIFSNTGYDRIISSIDQLASLLIPGNK